MFDATDETLREELAEASYYRERAEEAALDREHDATSDASYFALSWESISDHAKRPYRTAVAEVCDAFVAAGV